MSSSSNTKEKLWKLLEPIVEGLGFDLVELEYLRQRGWIVRLFIDRPNISIIEGLGVAPGQGVTLDECTQVSRQVSAILDVEDLLPHSYTLEVSSPGVQRPLSRATDYLRFIGCPVRVKTYEPISPQDENNSMKPSRNMRGILLNSDEKSITVDVQGTTFNVPLKKISRAHLDPDMDQWMKIAQQARQDRGEK